MTAPSIQFGQDTRCRSCDGRGVSLDKLRNRTITTDERDAKGRRRRRRICVECDGVGILAIGIADRNRNR